VLKLALFSFLGSGCCGGCSLLKNAFVDVDNVLDSGVVVRKLLMMASALVGRPALNNF
jgi:hypothetical protein